MKTRIATVEMARAAGFTAASHLDPKEMELLPEVRQMCADNRCGMYGKTWACPPACGTLDSLEERLRGFDYGLILQVTEKMEDPFDVEAMERAETGCNASLDRLAAQLRKMCAEVLTLRAGACTLCKACTYPDSPCRFPQRVSPSLEAAGILVSRECERSGLPYYYGPNTITFVSAVLLRDQ